MTENEQADFDAAVQAHNEAVAADIQAKIAELDELHGELKVADAQSAKLRDNLAQAVNVFNHQFRTSVQPFLSVDDQEGAAPVPSP